MKRSRDAARETHSSEERTRVLALDGHLGAMQNALQHMRMVSGTLLSRWQVRDKRALDCRIDTIVIEMDRITNGFYLSKLDKCDDVYHARRSCKTKISDTHETKPGSDAQPERKVVHDPQTDSPSSSPYSPPIIVDISDDTCAICEGGMRLVVAKSLMCCRLCGYAVTYLDSTVSALAYGDDANMASTFSYKRINHFAEWITRIQAKTTYEVPQEIIDSVMCELATNEVAPRDVTQAIVSRVLKKLNVKSKLNEYIAHIMMRLTGRHPPRLTDEMEQLLKLCFIALQVPFAAHAPANRKNFMSYSYVLFRLCQLLGYDDILPSLTLLKGKSKLAKQDEIFILCCRDLDWEFTRSTLARPLCH